MAKGQNPNAPTAGKDESKWIQMGQSQGPYGNDPFKDARGEFGQPVKDLGV